MKPSKFNILTQAKDDPGRYLLYNTLHDHRILFDDPDVNPVIFFDKIKNRIPLTSKENAMVPDLEGMGLLLQDDFDEQKAFEDWYHTKIRERTDIMQVTILPTMACNLACDYCFENEVREDGIMKPETAEKTIDYLKRRLRSVRPSKLNMMFFGGEPLLHQTPIKLISKEISAFSQSLQITMDIGMITNGVLLTPEFVDEMVPYGFKWVKITFDGDREAHDKKRIYHNRKGTFDVIYDNLCKIKGKLRIAIGGNFDNENYESFFQLIERLKSSPFSDDIMVARFKPILPINAEVASQRQGRISSFCEVCSYNTAQINGIMSLEEKIWDVGIPSQNRPEMGPCEYHSRQSFTIGPDGTLYKCPAFVGLRNLAAGHVSEERDYNENGEWQIGTQKWDDDCEKCHFLPNCAGGCRYSALNKTGSLEVKNCEYQFLERETDAFMQREIKAMSEGVEIPDDPTLAVT